MSCNPVFVVRIDVVGLSGGTTIWKASTRPYPTSPTYEGRIVGRVVSFGDLTHSMCDRNGSPVVNRFEVLLFDPDNYWRTILANPDTQYLTSQDITYLFGSDDAVATEGYPLMPLFRGQLLDPSPRPGKHFSFQAESRLGTRKGPYDLDQPVNKVTAQRAVDDGFAAVPRENIEKRLPVLWGEKTDKGTVNEYGELIEMGRCPGVNLGPLPGTSAVFLSKPQWGTPQKFLTGSPVSLATSLGPRTYTYIFGARTVDGQWSLSDPLTITGLPSPEDFSDDGSGHRGFGTGVRLFVNLYTDPTELTAITNPETGDHMGNLWVKDGAADSAAEYRHMDGAGEAYTIGYDDNGDDSHYKPWGPALPGTRQAQLNAEAGDFWCFLRHPGKITQLFGSNLGGGLDGVVSPDDDPDTEDMPIGGEAKYVQLTNGNMVDMGDGTGLVQTINGHCYFGVILSGALMIAAREGFPPRANLCGWHVDNNLANPIIDQAALCVQDTIVQLTGGPEGRGYESGARLSIPSFASAPTVPIIQTSRIQETQNQTKAFLGTALGYLACIYFGPDDATTWRSHLEQVTIDWNFDHFENEHGQFTLSIMDDTQSPDDGSIVRERIELAGGRVVDAGAVVSAEIQNVRKYQTGYDPIEGTYRSGVLERRDAISVGQYGERGAEQGRVYNHKYTEDPATAQDAAARFIADRAIGPSYPAVVGKLRRMLPLPLGRQFRIQHSDLITDAPIPVYLRERVISARNGTITLKGRSRQGTYAAVVAGDETPTFSEASDTEQAAVFFVSDEQGLLPDGSLGPRVR